MPDTASSTNVQSGLVRRCLTSFVHWFDSDFGTPDLASLKEKPDRVEWVRAIPFLILHLGCLGAIWTGWSWFAVGSAIFLYFARMFAVTGFYHRYFSHRTFSTSRVWQFVLALWGGACVQRGALWWAYTHRHHHQHSDDPQDKHSPRQHGFIWAHIGWITSAKNFPTDYSRIKDLAKFPELVFLNRFDILVPFLFAVSLFGLGKVLEKFAPGLGTNGPQMLVWGFFISTTFLFHGTSCINSMAHVWGNRRFETDDDSRNSFILSLITLGEGWHNNHHKYMGCTRQGFYWWEIDITYYLLKVMSWMGLIWDLRPVPSAAYEEANHISKQHQN